MKARASSGGRLGPGDVRKGPLDLARCKVSSVVLRENELRVSLRQGGAGIRFELVLKGIIASKDEGVIGRPLGMALVEDFGSYRVIRIRRPNGKGLFRCDYLEGEVRPASGPA